MPPARSVESEARASRLRFQLGGLVALVALSLASCSPVKEMRAELDGIPLPEHLTLLDEERGPTLCFAGDCPWVDRTYASPRAAEEACRDVRAAIEEWGVGDVRWRLAESERNPCTGSALRNGYWVSVAVFEFARLEGLSHRVADGAPAGSRAAVRLGLRQP